MIFRSISAACLLAFSGMSQAHSQSPLEQVAEWMTGSFNSEQQSIDDQRYYNINLEMKRIWAQRTDAIWLYVEQAVATSMEKPYRQRVYKLTQADDNLIVSEVYTLPDPENAIGAWKDDNKLAHLSPAQLVLRKGCHININYQHDDKATSVSGSTDAKKCGSKLRGASYATSEVVIDANLLTSWDRGFDADDKHVWGAEAGPYKFDKVKNYKLD